jgi:hypothetical protein
MKSSYFLRNITVRNTYASGSAVTPGPPVSTNYPLGYFREDYEYLSSTSPDRLDQHNGRFCVTPEYPNGTYAYFCTVDSNWNSAYPYVVGPTFYGTRTASKVTAITEPVTQYIPAATGMADLIEENNMVFYPNPAGDLLAIQLTGLNSRDIQLCLSDLAGRELMQTTIHQGSTIGYFDTRTLYSGEYLVHARDGDKHFTKRIIIAR